MIIQEFVFEMWCGMSEFDHHIYALLKQQQRERPEKLIIITYLHIHVLVIDPHNDLLPSWLN